MTMQTITEVLSQALLPVSIVLSLLLVLFGIRTAVGAKTRAPKRIMARRIIATVLTLALAGSSWAGYFGAALKNAAPDADAGPEDIPVATAAATEEKDQPLNAVNLTKLQIDNFLADYSLLFDNLSLVSKAQTRLDLIKGYGLNFQGSVYIPVNKVLDKLDQINNGTLKGEELEALYKEVRHDIYQSIISNPVVLDMWLQLLSSLSSATENNGWITEYMAEFDEAFAHTTDPQGLDCFLEYASGGKDIMVTRHCAEIAVHVCYVLEQLDLKGITKRTSSANWELPVIDEETGAILNDEDSRTRTRESKTQEAEMALLFTFVNKGGKEVLALGVNLYDQRAEVFPTNVKEPVATIPTETPRDDTPKEEPKQPTTKYYNLTIKYLEVGTNKTMFDQYGPKSYKKGADYSVTSPQKEGYTCSQPTVSGSMPAENKTIIVWYTPQTVTKSYNLTIKYLETSTEKVMFDQYGPTKYEQGASYSVASPQKEGYTCSQPVVEGSMPGQDQTITVWYTPIPQEKSNHILQVQYYLEDGVTPAPGITWISTVLKTGDSYSYTSPTLKGYTPDRAVVSGTMPDHDQVEKVIYKINSYNLKIHYQEKGTNKTLANDYSKSYKYQEYYQVESPSIKGYVCETPIVYGYMPDRDVEVTVYYVKEAVYELRIHYVEKGTNRTLADDYADDYKEGATYRVESPEIRGYVCEQPVVSGTMPKKNVEITVYYTKEATDHTLTIYYEYITGGRAAATYRGTYKEGQHYSVASPSISGWTAVTSLVEGTMGDHDLEFTVIYTKDGNGTTKDPDADPGPQGNAPEKGGDNDTTQGEGGVQGKPQDEKPADHDYGNGDQSTGQDRNDLDQNGNSTIPNVPGQGDDESSGTGGVDHPQQDGEGGYGEGLDIPDKDPIPEHNDNDQGTGGGWADEEIDVPPV